MASILEATGNKIIRSSDKSGAGVLLLARSVGYLTKMWEKRIAILQQMHFCGVESLAVTMVVAIFTGMILGLQAGIELSRYQQQDAIGYLVSATMCREMGPFMTGIILAACVGSTMAAELGTMQVSEEIDALEVMSISPVKYLVMPRVVALTIMCPILTVLTNLVGIVGGGIVGKYQLGVSYNVYFDNALDILEVKDVYTGLFKSVVFGVIIATIGCNEGLRATGGARGVGKATRDSVVISFLLILIFGYYLTRFFY